MFCSWEEQKKKQPKNRAKVYIFTVAVVVVFYRRRGCQNWAKKTKKDNPRCM